MCNAAFLFISLFMLPDAGRREKRKTWGAWEGGKKEKRRKGKKKECSMIESIVSNLYFHGFVVIPDEN